MFWRKKKQDIDPNLENQGGNPEEVYDDKVEAKNKEANNKAREYLNDKEKLKHLIEEAEEKASKKDDKKGFVQENWESLITMFELIKSYIKGDYRNIPYGSLVIIVGAILYFVMPADAIPDFLAGLGFTDDAAVIVFALKKVKDDIDKFKVWKSELEENEA